MRSSSSSTSRLIQVLRYRCKNWYIYVAVCTVTAATVWMNGSSTSRFWQLIELHTSMTKTQDVSLLLLPTAATTTATATGAIAIKPDVNEEDDVVIPFERGTESVVCTVVKDGEPYIDEWVDYHIALGFAHFYIYLNEDYPYLQKWATLRGDYVTVIHYPSGSIGGGNDNIDNTIDGDNVRNRAYQNCSETLVKLQSNYTWVAFFDIDEFLVFKNQRFVHIDAFLREYGVNGALAINWLLFGTSFVSEYSPIPVTKRCQRRMESTIPFVKTIARIEHINTDAGFQSPHWVPLRENIVWYDTNRKQIDQNQDRNPDGPLDVAVFHHYYSKSRKELKVWLMSQQQPKLDKNNETVLTIPKETAILDEYYHDDERIFNVNDDSAWVFLKSRVPLYRFYDIRFQLKQTPSPWNRRWF